MPDGERAADHAVTKTEQTNDYNLLYLQLSMTIGYVNIKK